MAQEAINPTLRLYQDKFNEEGYSHVNHLSRGLLTNSELLSPVVTHLYYKMGSQNFPLSFLTEGMKRTRSIKSVDLSYQTPIMGRPKTDSTIATNLYAASDKPGIAGSSFEIPFSEKWFKPNQILYSPNKDIQVQVKSAPKQQGNMYFYTVTLIASTKAAFCPPSLLAGGIKWAGGIVKVGIANSVGTEHRSQSPGKMTNQLSVVRDTFQIRGNVENKIMVVEIPTEDGGTMKYWSEFEYYLKNLEWKEVCEDDLWYSLYNKTEDGEIITVDELAGGEFTPSGAGVLQQIPNRDTYSKLTTNKLTQVIRNAFFNASEGANKSIEVFTGTGGLEEADRAMKDGAKGFTLVDSKVVTGQNFDMVFGAYFKTFRHVDGHTVTFRHLPLMDRGRIAKISGNHPTTGLPLESYNMYFLDMSTYDGEANMQYVSEQGREQIDFVVAGAKVPNGYDQTVFRATSRDGSTIETMKTQGISIKRPTNCFRLECVLN
jgi:hypothetical protein